MEKKISEKKYSKTKILITKMYNNIIKCSTVLVLCADTAPVLRQYCASTSSQYCTSTVMIV